MSLKNNTLLLIFILNTLLLSAQQKPLKITVRNTDKTSLPGATLTLKNQSDLAPFYATTDADGHAAFNKVNNGKYVLKISYIGFKSLDTTLTLTSANRSFEYIMVSESISLGEVNIVARKPLIRQEEDLMIIDPTPIANTSTNTLEILESTPGLYVDPDGGIFLSTSSPAAIYINGREQKMSNQDIATILRSLPPNSVEKIEVLRTPSTKYDAASSGGIINIVLKKGVKIGRFGSVSMGGNKGVEGNCFAGFSLNNSGSSGSRYLNANFSQNNNVEDLNSTRFLQGSATLSQAAKTTNRGTPLYLGYGVNYEKNQNLSFSYDGRINGGRRNSESTNTNLTKNAEQILLAESVNSTSTKSGFISIQQDFGMNLKFDTLGSNLDTKLNYSFNGNTSNQDYSNHIFSPLDTLFSGKTENNQSRHFVVFQSDLTYQLPLKIKLETGIKSSAQQYNSNADFSLFTANTFQNDPSRTAAFAYFENLNAAYIQASRSLIAGFMLKTGLRMEHTYMKGTQTLPFDTNFIVNRADWFPYVYLSRRVMKIMGAELFGYVIYRKTISRPGYQDLNPGIKIIDQFLYETGNPSLRPQFTENIEVNVSYDDMPVFAIGRNYTTDIFSMVMYKDPNQENVLVRTYDNLGKNTETYFRGLVGIPPGGKYFFAAGAQYNLNEYDGYYENKPLKYSHGSWRFFTFHSLTLFKETKLTINGFLMTNGWWNFYEMKNFGQLNVGLTQTFLNKKLTVSLNARDILKTMGTEFSFNQGSINSIGDRFSDSQRVGFNVRYNFGMKKKDEPKGMPGFEEPEM